MMQNSKPATDTSAASTDAEKQAETEVAKVIEIENAEDSNSENSAENATASTEESGEQANTTGELAEQLEMAQAEIIELKDQFLRAKAEADNTRRRAERDVASSRKYAVESFAREMLQVKDSLDLARGLEIAEDDQQALEKMHEGLDLTLKQLDSVFERFSIEVINPEPGEKLDPNRHQAMSVQESDEVDPNHILFVVQKGFALHDRLLRPAMVVVAKAPVQDPQEANDKSSD